MDVVSWMKRDATGAPVSSNKKKKSERGKVRTRAQLSREEGKKLNLDDESEAIKNVLTLLLKGQANLFQRTRVMEAAVADCYHVPTICTLVDVADQAYRGYENSVKDNPRHTNGPPGPHVFAGLIIQLHKMDIGGNNKEWCKSQIATLNSSSPDATAIIVPFCRMRMCYDEDYHKLIVIITDTTVRHHFRLCMGQVQGCKHFTGPAPPSAMEDQVSKWLQSLSI